MVALFHKKAPHTPACMVAHLVLSALFVLASLLALAGVIMTHVMSDADGWFLEIGSSQGSLAIIAFALVTTLAWKQVVRCCTKCEVCK